MNRYTKGFVAIIVVFMLGAYAFAGEDKITTEDLLEHHLNSIADANTRKAMKSRVVEGTAAYKVVVGGTGEAKGKAILVSDTDKLHMLLKIQTQQFNGERFIKNGDKTQVFGTYPDKSRSEFGRFLEADDLPLREGLLGGVLTTDWSLLDLNAHKSKLRYEGSKKVDGKELYVVAYQPKKSSDINITLYFDPATFHHVMTIYSASVHAGITPGATVGGDPNGAVTFGSSETASAGQTPKLYRIEERFSDFKTTDGLTLPTHYNLRYEEQLPEFYQESAHQMQRGFSQTVEWDVTTTNVLSNVTVDAKNFQIQ